MRKAAWAVLVWCIGMQASTDFGKLSIEELLALRGSVSPYEIKAYSRELRSRLQSLPPRQRKALMSKNRARTALGTRSSNSALDALRGDLGGHGNGRSAGNGAENSGGNGGHGGGGNGGGGHGGR